MTDLELEFTGERYVTSISGNIRLEHFHRYALASRLVAGKAVLDIACGEGYGSQLLSGTASHVTGVDVDSASVEHALRKYGSDRVTFRQGKCSAIPLDDASVDAVVSFETIEHHTEHEAMFQEIKRVLRPGGVLVMSSPDKYEYSDVPQTVNEYHVKELYKSEFEDLLKRHFAHHLLYGQRVSTGSLIVPTEAMAAEFVSFASDELELAHHVGLPKPLYLIGIASDEPLPPVPAGIFTGPSDFDNTMADYERRIAAAQATIDGLAREKADDQRSLAAQRQEATQMHDRLVQQIDQRDRLIASLEERISGIHHSTSWRVTAPLRWVMAGLYKVAGRRVA